MRSPLLAGLVGALCTGSVAARAPRPYTLVVVDSPGQPADDLAREAWRQTRHRRSRCDFRWIRVGAPVDHPELADALAGAVAPEGSSQVALAAAEAAPERPAPRKAPIEIERDERGEEVAAWRLSGVPRLVLLDEAGHVLFREVFLPVPDLRYLVRHPDGFPSRPSATRIQGAEAAPGANSRTRPHAR